MNIASEQHGLICGVVVRLLGCLTMILAGGCVTSKNPAWVERVFADPPTQSPQSRVEVQVDQHRRIEYYLISTKDQTGADLVFCREFLYRDLEWEGWLENGEREGTWKKYHENGDLGLIQHYKAGRIWGWVAWWYEGGLLAGLMEYKDDRPHGRYLEWHANGRMESKGELYGDNLQGRCTEWNEDGTVFTDRVYDLGEIKFDYAVDPSPDNK